MIDPKQFGVSFSLKQCQSFGLDPKACLEWLIEKGWRRFRLMSYWNLHETEQGVYDFTALDWQIDMIEQAGGVATLALGVKQPRWPEYHWPAWAQELDGPEKAEALLEYIAQVVERYRGRVCIVSYQLENEALLSNFGELIDIDNDRLKREYDLVKRLDPARPVVMSTSNGWGIPLIGPIPDEVGFSVYTVMFQNGHYTKTIQKPWLHRLRKRLIWFIWKRPVFIHELQAEPWGKAAIWNMSTEEQAVSMNAKRIKANIATAKSIKATPIDLWGAEWWYWRWIHGDQTIYAAVESGLETAPNPTQAVTTE